jgi:hypothetical protein
MMTSKKRLAGGRDRRAAQHRFAVIEDGGLARGYAAGRFV